VFSGGHTAVSAGLAGWAEELVAGCRAVRDGRYVRDAPWLLVGTPTLADPSRAPAGHHTVKLISPQAYLPELDKEEHARHQLTTLRRFCPGFTDEVVLASLVRGPADIEAANPHMIRGTFHGGDRGLPFSGALRPAPGWAQHRMPIRGLYQTGGTTHPGGSITGGPGRNAAAVVLQDLGTSIEEVVDGGRARALGR
jgi:phytoene dehydrogenase-like protein